ncbi:MAG TPA: alpha/beta family hydrolase [Asanoa sp.]|jgi:predicted alpha/beta-hydrolase family hydrolase
MTRARTIETPHGPAAYDIEEPVSEPTALLVLGHGAGGGVDAPDIGAVRRAAVAAGLAVARVKQPYLVAGRRTPAPAHQLDTAWATVVEKIKIKAPLVVGGRSSGARVACRTASDLGAAGIVCLAFPLHPPGRPERSRAGELETGLPTLVVNGTSDPFGMPAEGPDRTVVQRPGQRHDLKGDLEGLGVIVVGWLAEHGWARTPQG